MAVKPGWVIGGNCYHDADVPLEVVTEEFDFTASSAIAAGTIGTRGSQRYADDPHASDPSYTLLGLTITHVGASDKYIPIVFYSAGKIYCNLYRAVTTEISAENARVIVVASYAHG